MPTKRSAKDRAAEQADYATWKITAGADLLERHGVKPGTIQSAYGAGSTSWA
jgi:hypothetical protein